MKKKSSLLTQNQGFTLLEVVITLIVGSILGAILVQFMGTSMKNSFEPVIMVQNGNGVNEVMEKMNSDYKMRLLTSTVDPLYDFKNDVENGNVLGNVPYFGNYAWVTKYITFDVVTNVEDAAVESGQGAKEERPFRTRGAALRTLRSIPSGLEDRADTLEEKALILKRSAPQTQCSLSVALSKQSARPLGPRSIK